MKLVKKKILKNIIFLFYRRIYIILYQKVRWAMPEIKRPHIIEIELTNNCNLSCVHCHRSKMDRPVGNMEFSVFTKLIDELAKYPVAFLRIVGQGESALHPQFSDLMRYASGKSIKIELTTNGTVFDLYPFKEIVNWDIDILGISLDGIDKASYEQIRKGGNYEKLSNNIQNFYKFRNASNKKYPLICLRNVIFPSHTAQHLNNFKEQWQGTVDQITFNNLNKFTNVVDTRLLSISCCKDFFFNAHIRYDGSVLLCQHQFLYGQNEVIGNLKMTSLRNIWKSNRLKEIRFLHQKRNFPQACKICFSNMKNNENYSNSNKYNSSSNKIVNLINKIINLT